MPGSLIKVLQDVVGSWLINFWALFLLRPHFHRLNNLQVTSQ